MIVTQWLPTNVYVIIPTICHYGTSFFPLEKMKLQRERKRDREKEKELPSTPKMAVMAVMAGVGQVAGVCSWSSTGVQGSKHVGHVL